MPYRPRFMDQFCILCLLLIALFSYGCKGNVRPELVHPGVTRLTEVEVFSLTKPAWSPDGLRLVAVSEEGRESIRELYLVEIPTGKLTQLTNDKDTTHNNAPSWSPDGDRIAFTSDEFGQYGVGFLDLESGKTQFLHNGHEIEWAPDGQSVVIFLTGPILFDYSAQSKGGFGFLILDLATGDGQLLYDGETPYVKSGGMEWARAGKQIAVSFQSLEKTGLYSFDRDIYVINTEENKLTQVIASEEDEVDPTWSPEGNKLAYTRGPFHLQRFLWVSNADGSCPVQLLDVEGIIAPAWSPGGKYIAFEYNSNLYLLDLTVEPIAERLKGLNCHY